MSEYIRPVPNRPASGGAFETPRPFTGPPYTHIHGARDYVLDIDEAIFSPRPGDVYRFVLIRPPGDAVWEWGIRDGGMSFPWQGYGYDLYGGVTVLRDDKGLVHLFCHTYMAQLWKLCRGIQWAYQEQPQDARWPLMLWHTFGWPVRVGRGEMISLVGNAGHSTGPHLHWEIHRGWTWTPHADRVDPEALF